MDWSHFA